MSTKDEWKDTGKAFGSAFKRLAKTSIKSVSTGIHKAEEWANEDDDKENQNGKTAESGSSSDSNVFNDGSWRNTGKDIGNAFKGLGKTIARTAEDGTKKAESWAKSNEEEAKVGGTITVEAKEVENNA